MTCGMLSLHIFVHFVVDKLNNFKVTNVEELYSDGHKTVECGFIRAENFRMVDIEINA